MTIIKLLPKSLLPILISILFATFSRLFVENPPYPVSPVHACLVFALAVLSWFYLSFSVLRQSYGGYACGVALGFLAITTGLLPDLWLRWPLATITSLGISQLATYVVYKALEKRPNFRLEAGLFVSAVSIIPLALLPYVHWASRFNIVIAIIGALVLLFAAFQAWKHRQNRVSLSGLFSWLILTLLVTTLYFGHFSGYLESTDNRQHFEEYLLFALIVMAAAFMADLLQVEQQLRSGPHMELDVSLKDPLTNLANRRALEVYGPQIINQSHEAGRAVSVIVADIDHFKEINDTHGHPTGDIVLRKTADKLAAQVRKSDLVSRYGGEEFVIVLPGSPLAPALRLAERMRASIEAEAVPHNNLNLKRTVSFGVATAFPEEPASLAELIQKADRNLYRAKHAGRNRVMADALPTQPL